MRSNIKKVFFFYLFLFFVLIAYLLFFTFVQSEKIKGNSYNPRVKASQNTDVLRGKILDKNGTILAQTKNNKRTYPYNNVFSHTVGFVTNGGYGVECKYNFDLQTLNNNIWQRFINEINKKNILQGNDIVLTLDANLQQFCYNQIKNKNGAIIVMDNKTGQILSMVSSPSFNPNNVEKNWDSLVSDTKNNYLLNKATQGLYPPASIFKIITATAFIENYPQWQDYTYTCKGHETIDGVTIDCFDKTSHGTINLEQALAQSCNSFFTHLSTILPPQQVSNVAKKVIFNNKLNFSLPYKQSIFTLKKDTPIDEIMQTYIGQGKTLVTPLHIAMIGCALANNGTMMTPYIVEHVVDFNGNIVKQYNPKNLTEAFLPQTANIITTMLQKVITEGTGKKAYIKDLSIWAKTGTAQVDNQKDHTWFLGAAPANNSKIVVCVFLENSGSNSNIVTIAKNIFEYYKPMLN